MLESGGSFDQTYNLLAGVLRGRRAYSVTT